jgi:hyperosmotically inducible protein
MWRELHGFLPNSSNNYRPFWKIYLRFRAQTQFQPSRRSAMSMFTKVPAFVAAMGLVVLTGCHVTDDDVTVGEAIDDTVITTKVEAALIDDEQLSALDIDVDTREGVVQLSGFVDDRTDISRAGDLASTIEGVRSVRNDLTLK